MRHHNPIEAFYWDQVRKVLHVPLIDHAFRRLRKVVYYGEYSADKQLKSVVEVVMRSFLDKEDMPDIVEDGIDSVFTGALGAAELAECKPYWDSNDDEQSTTLLGVKYDV